MKTPYIFLFLLIFNSNLIKASNNGIDPVFMLGMDYPYIRDRMKMQTDNIMEKTFLAWMDKKDFFRMFPLIKTKGNEIELAFYGDSLEKSLLVAITFDISKEQVKVLTEFYDVTYGVRRHLAGRTYPKIWFTPNLRIEISSRGLYSLITFKKRMEIFGYNEEGISP